MQTKTHMNWGVLFEYSIYYNYESHSREKHDIKQGFNYQTLAYEEVEY